VLIEAAGARVEPVSLATASTNKQQVQALALAGGEEVTRSSVLAEIERFASQLAATKSLSALGELIEVMGRWAPDPRVGATLVRMMNAHATVTPRTIQLRLMRALWPHFDCGLILEPENFPRIPSLGAALRRATRARAPKQIMTDAEVRELTALIGRWSEPRRALMEEPARERQLLEHIIANPDDDGLRAVYADWLVERGRPMGELIQLELRKLDASGRARRAVLLKELRTEIGAQFGGGIHLPSARRARGFVTEARLEQTHHPLVALLEGVRFEATTQVSPHTRFDQLRRAEGLTVDQVVEVLPLAVRLEELDFTLDLRRQPQAIEKLAKVEHSARVVHCHTAGNPIDEVRLRALWRTRFLSRTEHLRLGKVSGLALFELVRAATGSLQSISFLDGDSMCWVLTRRADRFDQARGIFLDGLKLPRDVETFLHARSTLFTGAATFEIGRGRPDVVKSGLASAGSFGGSGFQLIDPTPKSSFDLIKSLEP
jgi:uncharacterized protein (TIGR02996 family)